MHAYPAYSLPAEGKGADSTLLRPRLWGVLFLIIFALAACSDGKGGTLDGTPGPGTSGMDGGDPTPPTACETSHTTDTCLGFSGTDAAPDFTLRGGQVNGNVTGGDEINIFMLLGGTVSGYVDAGDGDDEITLGFGTWDSYDGGERGEDDEIARKVWGGAGADTLILDGATITNDIIGDDEVDAITLMSGTVMGYVDGGVGADEITIQNADVEEYLLWDSQDTIALTGSGSLAELQGTDDPDVIVIDDGTTGIELSSTFTLGFIDLRGGADSLTLNTGTWDSYNGGVYVDGTSVSTDGAIYGGAGADSFTLESGATIGNIVGADFSPQDSANPTSEEMADGQDIFVISGTVNGYVDGGVGADTITINGASATVSGYLQYDAADTVTLSDGSLGHLLATTGVDTITIGGTAGPGTIAFVSGFTLDFINLAGGADSLTLNTGTWDSYNGGVYVSTTSTSTDGAIYGGAGTDSFTLESGATIGNIVGADFSPQDSANPTSEEMADGQDIFVLSGTVNGYVDGLGGADTITIDGASATVSGYLQYDKDDIVTLTTGSLNQLLGTGDVDEIIIDSAADATSGTLKIAATGFTLGFIDLQSEDDSLTLMTGTWDSYNGGVYVDGNTRAGGAIYGGEGADSFTLEGTATISNNIIGGDEADIFMLMDGTVGGYVDAAAGNDTITLGFETWDSYDGGVRSDETARKVWGGAGTDTFILESGATVNSNVIGEDNERDIFQLSGMVNGYVDAQGGDDAITLLGTSTWHSYSGGSPTGTPAAGSVFGGAGADSFTLEGTATISNNIIGDAEADTFMLTSGNVGLSTYLDAGAGDDTIRLGFETWHSYDGGDRVSDTTARKVWGGVGTDMFILEGSANIDNGIMGGDNEVDTIMLMAGMVGGNVDGRGGADMITINGSVVVGYLQYAEDDTITLTTGSLGELQGTGNAETIMFVGSDDAAAGTVRVASAVDFTLGKIDMLGGADTITFSGGLVSGYLQYAGDDMITLTTGSLGELRGTGDVDEIIIDGNVATAIGGTLKIAATGFTLGFIDLLVGDDSLTLITGTWDSYNGDVYVDGNTDTGGAIYGGAGADTLILAGATITNNIIGDAEDETFTLTSGAVGDDTYVDASAGEDTITLGFETWDSYNGGVRGNDETARKVWGGAGADMFILNRANIINNIIGDGANEIFMLMTGTVGGYVDAAAGDDTITLGFGRWDSYNGGVRGNDETARKVWGGTGADSFTLLDGATIDNNIVGDGEAETFTLTGGAVGDDTYVDAAAGDDTITLGFGTWHSYDGGMRDRSDTTLTKVWGGAGADTFILDGATIGYDLDTDGDGMTEDDEIAALFPSLADTTQRTAFAASNGDVTGGDEADIFMLMDGTILGDVDGGGGADMITIDGVDVNVMGYLLYDEDDTITLTTGALGELQGAASDETIIFVGSDTAAQGMVEVTSAFTLDKIDLLGGADSITINGGEVSGYLLYDEDDTITLTTGALGELRGTASAETAIFGGPRMAAQGMIEVITGFRLGVIDFLGGADTITFSGGRVSGYLQYDPLDIVTLTSGFLGELRGTDDPDAIIIDGNAADAGPVTTGGRDRTLIKIEAGFNISSVDLLDGDDFLEIATGTWDSYDGGEQDSSDTTTTKIWGGTGEDTFKLESGATIENDIIGEDDETDIFQLSGTVRGYVDALGGDDTITLVSTGTWDSYDGGARDSSDTTAMKIWGGAGEDTFFLGGLETIVNNIIGENGETDIFQLSGRVDGYVDARSGDDTITLSGTGMWAGYYGGAPHSTCTEPAMCDDPLGTGVTVNDNPFTNGETRVYGGAGVDTLILNGPTITKDITGDDEVDTITLMSGMVGGDVDGLGGEDTIEITGADVMGYLQYDPLDIVTLDRGSIGELRGTDGNDTIIIDGDVTQARAGTLLINTSFAIGFVDLLGGGDRLTLKTGTWDSYDGGDRGSDTTPATKIWGGTGADTFILESGATITNNVIGEDDERDFFELSGTVTGYVDALGGNDRITLDGDDTVTLGGTTTWAGYYGGAPVACTDPATCTEPLGTGVDNPFTDSETRVYGGEGQDAFILGSKATITGDVIGEDSETDTFELSGTVMGYVDALGGDDTIRLLRGTWAGYYGGAPDPACTDPAICPEPLGTGVDNPFEDSETRVYGGAGGDTFVLNGATITNSVTGDGEGENFSFSAGTVMGYVDAQGGDDTIEINDGIWNSYDGGDRGTDTTPATKIWGGTGADKLILRSDGERSVIDGTISSGGTITGNVIGEDSETDTFELSGMVNGYVDALSGDDEITLRGTGTWDSYDGGMRGSSENTATKVWGGAGADNFTLGNKRTMDRVTITNNIMGDDEAETFTLMSGTIMGNLDAGDGDDTINLEGDVIMPTTGTTIRGGAGMDTLNYNGGRILDADGVERTDSTVTDERDLFQQIETCTGEFPALPTPRGECGGDATLRSSGFEQRAFSPDFVPAHLAQEDSQRQTPSPEPLQLGGLQGFERLTFSPELSLAAVLPSALQDFSSATASLPVGLQKKSGLWIREEETQNLRSGRMRLAKLHSLEADGSYRAKINLAQQGYDKHLTQSRAFTLRSFMHLAKGETAAQALTGKADIQGYGAGFALLWQGTRGYAQAATLASRFEADLIHQGKTEHTKGKGFLLSMETGFALPIGTLTLKPKARILWKSLSLNDFSQDNQRLAFGDDKRFETHLGATLEGESWMANAFIVNTSGETASLTTGMTQNYHADDLAFELGARTALADVWGFDVSGKITHRISLEYENSTTASLKLSRPF